MHITNSQYQRQRLQIAGYVQPTVKQRYSVYVYMTKKRRKSSHERALFGIFTEKISEMINQLIISVDGLINESDADGFSSNCGLIKHGSWNSTTSIGYGDLC